MKRLADKVALDALFKQCAHETGFHPGMLSWGFDRMFAHWNPKEMEEFCITELPDISAENYTLLWDADTSLDTRKSIFGADFRYKRIFLLAASTVPSATFQDVLLYLMTPMEVILRPAGNLAGLFHALHDYLKQRTPNLAQRLKIADTGHDAQANMEILQTCDVLNLSGADKTIKQYNQWADSIGTNPLIIKHGHRVSSVVIRHDDFKTWNEQDYAGLALDASVWDLMGCLSPRCIFIEADFKECIEFAKNLINAMRNLPADLRWMEQSLNDQVKRNTATQLCALDGAEILRDGADIIIIHAQDTVFAPMFLPRILNIYSIENGLDVAGYFSPRGQALCTKYEPDTETVKRMKLFGYNYFCRPGEMQDPPLTWLHDGVGTLRPLCS